MLAQRYADQPRIATEDDQLRPIPHDRLLQPPPPRDWMVEGCFARGTVAMISGDGGIGKCHGAGTPIVMYDGTVRPVEGIRNGDVLMGPDSRPRIVRGTTSGWGPLFRVTPIKGDPYVVNAHHVLSLKWTPRTNKPRPTHPVNVPVREYLGLPKQERRHLMGWRPDCLHWPERPVDIPPYLMGLWLGDGSASDSAITTPDAEAVEAMQEYADSEGLWVNKVAECGAASTYRIRGRGGRAPNPFREALRSYGVYAEKSIPHVYIENSSDVRMELLAGLLDADGYLVNGCYEIAQKSEPLAADILFLARSLGFAAYGKIKMARAQTHTDKRPYHRIHISGEIDRIPVRIERRKAKPRQQKKRVLVTGISVEPIGEGPYYGFEVDGDHLYLLGDFTVTHNSLLVQQLLTSAVLGEAWLGLSLKAGKALFFACEDDEDELHRRQADINRSIGAAMRDVLASGLELHGRTGRDNALARLDRREWKMLATDLLARLGQRCMREGIQYVVIDTATQTFAGNQNDEQQVVQFINQLRRLAIAIQGIVVITKHPSLSGRALGTGEGGSTSWNNSVRSRLYMREDKDGQLLLSGMKANYGKRLEKIPLRWDRGVFLVDAPEPSYDERYR